MPFKNRFKRLAPALLAALVAAPVFALDGVPEKKSDAAYDWVWLKGVNDDSVLAQKALSAPMAGGFGHHKAASSAQRLSLSGRLTLDDPGKELRYRRIVAPEWAERFSGPDLGAGLIAYQDDSLIDPGRYPLAGMTHTRYVGPLGRVLVGTPTELGESPMSNAARMASGQAPLDPENKPIHLCRLLNATDAPYYEMGQSEAAVMIRRSGGAGLSHNCRTGPDAEAYWKVRSKDFKNVLGWPSGGRAARGR